MPRPSRARSPFVRRLAAVAWLALAAACAEAAPPEPKYPPSKPARTFPTRDEVARVPARAVVPQVFGGTDVPVDAWSVASPPLPSVGAYVDDSAWGNLARELAKPRGDAVALSPAMRCVAGELARFHLEKHALPVEGLRRFIVARCGAETTRLAPYLWFINAPASVSDENLAARARDALANAIEERLAHGHHLLGLAVARDAKRAVVALATGEDEARLEPGERRVDATRHVTLRGVARGGYARVEGRVNRGDYGASRCATDLKVAPPGFAVTCELGPGDAFDWVELDGVRQGRVMMHPLADALIYDGDPAGVVYKARSHGAPAPVATPAELRAALVDRINGVRASGGIAPLALSEKQSAENERLVGTVLNGSVVGDDDAEETASVGLLAGWNVEGGVIRGGDLFLGTSGPTHDAMAWVERAIERPSGRMALLDPEVKLIAVGPSIPEGAAGLGAVVTTYALFGDGTADEHAADEALFFQRIREERAARGLPAPVRREASPDMRKAAARVLGEDVTPMGALHAMLENAEPRTLGYVLETTDLRRVEMPEFLLRPFPLPLEIVVTHHRAPAAAWGQYVVFAMVAR